MIKQQRQEEQQKLLIGQLQGQKKKYIQKNRAGTGIQKNEETRRP